MSKDFMYIYSRSRYSVSAFSEPVCAGPQGTMTRSFSHRVYSLYNSPPIQITGTKAMKKRNVIL